jgi:hypothetical protein
MSVVPLVFRAVVLCIPLIFCCTPSFAQCFASQVVAATVVSANEKSFTFQSPMHLCDGNGYTSGQITSAYVSIVRTDQDTMKAEKLTTAPYVYFEINYQFYSGNGTWAGSQPVILSIQDANHQNLLPGAIYDQNTPRGGCVYGHTIPVNDSGPLPNILDQIAYVTFEVPRVTGVQHPC